jgi:MraZ protein
MMFSGSYYHTVDSQGRIIIPAKFRKSPVLFLTYGINKCILAYTPQAWEEVLNKLTRISIKDEDFIKVFSGSAVEAALDNQGRITLPQEFRNYADLNREIAIVGVINKIEIWNRKNWESLCAKIKEEYHNLAYKLAEAERLAI